MKLEDAANNLAQLCTQLEVVELVNKRFNTPPLSNPAPAKLLALAIEDVIKALDK